MTLTISELRLSLAVALYLSNAPIVSAQEGRRVVDQTYLNQLRLEQGVAAAFDHAFEAGDVLSEHRFTSAEGVGAHIGEDRRFTRIPRADLDGPDEWANHFPKREGGANATSCIACHNAPIANGGGDVAQNVVLDPAHTGDPRQFLERNTLPLFALGPVQRVAEEMSLTLFLQRAEVKDAACAEGLAAVDLRAKGVAFGTLVAMRVQSDPCEVMFETGAVEGIDADLVVRGFGWKGNHATIRDFTRGAAHNELGLQAVETVGDHDGDYDGVIHELSVGDITALTTYMAALERPVSKLELAGLGLVDLSEAEREAIAKGAARFSDLGCAVCHTPSMRLDTAIFFEPSVTPGFFDVAFPDGSDPAAHGLLAEEAIQFDMTKGQPNNRIPQPDGSHFRLGSLPVDANDAPVLAWFSDFKRHDMGPALADPSDVQGIGAAMWLTRSLAGVGSTGPWLHDGRATTLHEAIIAHGGEAEPSRKAYASASEAERAAILAFLENQVIFKFAAEEE